MQHLQHNANEWERNAQSDALWAILTDDRKRSGGWDADEFFATGRDEAALVIARLHELGVFLDPDGSFLDFGCGVGRITRALMQYFAQGYGVDISQTMIGMANGFNAADPRRAEYIANARNDLSVLVDECVDFVYSHIVLQHVPSAYQIGFIEEFMRVLRPGGVAAFQIPTATVEGAGGRSIRAAKRMLHRILPAAALDPMKRALGKSGSTASVSMDMNVCSEGAVLCAVERNGGVLLDAPYTNSTDRNHGGRIRFMSRDEALGEIAEGRTGSPYLSQFFFVLK